MARIRTIKPESKKASIPMKTRIELATKYGAIRGKTTPVNCEICGLDGSIQWFVGPSGNGAGQVAFSLEIDHIKPESLGGATNARNLQLLCRTCNRSKGAK